MVRAAERTSERSGEDVSGTFEAEEDIGVG
jgi:hypothetical protein